MRKILKRAFCILLAVVLAVPGFGLESFAAEAGMDGAFAKTDGMSLTGSSSLGNLLTEKLEEEAEKQLENNGYNVFDTKIEDNVAVVSYEAKGDCTLIVAIYDETETQMYASGSIEVSSEETETQVQLETVNMPEYFIIKAYLVDTENMNPMCTVYENNMYTKEMQEFLEKTTEDFEEEKVVNLDSDITTNYLVCSEETKLIEGKEGVNEVTRADDESSTYTIENADKSVTSLKEGDIFVYPYEEDRILVVKISSMEVNGTTAVISGAETSLEEAFDYVRIEGSADTKDVEIDDSTCEEGVAYKGIGQDSADEDNDVTDMDRGSGKEEYTLSFRKL